eukprot:TRINITY_DN15344_c0_g1_i1.p1 TRINITY_DN15344_c0_g1~~TRINITY_DN15344_c0_g1_i1.p1  ORF type:complete len:454 (-),score=110.98 TRINITY_DN15344_c0_g1_i1:63-1424(-)
MVQEAPFQRAIKGRESSIGRPPTSGVSRKLHAAANLSLGMIGSPRSMVSTTTSGAATPRQFGLGATAVDYPASAPTSARRKVDRGPMGALADLGGALGNDRPYPALSSTMRRQPDKVASVQLDWNAQYKQANATEGDELREEVRTILRLVAEKARSKYVNARDAFRYVDANGDDAVSRSEVRFFFRSLNMVKEEADIVFDALCNDKDEIDYSIFVQSLWPYIAPESGKPRDKARRGHEDAPRTLDTIVAAATEDARNTDSRRVFRGEVGAAVQHVRSQMQTKFRNTRSAFRFVDCDKDGTVSREEMRYFLAQFGYPHVADDLFDLMDENRTGEITFQRFLCTFDVHANTSVGPAQKLSGGTPLQDRELDKDIREIAQALGAKLYTKFGDVRKAFRFLDIDKDGTISEAELDDFFIRMCIPVTASRKVFKALGEEGSDSVSAKKFYELFGPVIA